ncbi:MAG: hypothetical protein ACLR6I_19615 [Waltera sp.]
MIQGQMAKLPDIPVKYDGIPGEAGALQLARPWQVAAFSASSSEEKHPDRKYFPYRSVCRQEVPD